MMTRDEVIGQLLAMPEPVGLAEMEVLQAQAAVLNCREALADREAALLLGEEEPCSECLNTGGDPFTASGECERCGGAGVVRVCRIDGKNEAIRGAQLREATANEREAVRLAELTLASAKVRLATMRDQLAVWRSVARLIGGGE